jgi:DNA-binding MarR family transcriptional regulator
MFETAPSPHRELLDLISEVAKATRIFQQESVFCGGVTFIQFTILDQVARSGGTLSLARLHSVLEVKKSTTTRLVAPLVKKGLLEKRKSEEDSRAAILELTPEGRETWGEVLE